MKPVCLIEGCDRPGDHSRGLCRQCYEIASKAVRTGKVTWDQLVAAKMALPPHKPRTPFAKALAKANITKEAT